MVNSKETQKRINPNCPCLKVSCRRHGDCKACKHHHRRGLTWCKRIKLFS